MVTIWLVAIIWFGGILFSRADNSTIKIVFRAKRFLFHLALIRQMFWPNIILTSNTRYTGSRIIKNKKYYTEISECRKY